MMTRQEAFNKVCEGLAAQGFARSTRPPESLAPGCLYRGSQGRKCAVGHLLPDEVCNEQLNSMSVYTVLASAHDSVARSAGDWLLDHVPFDEHTLSSLQQVHDAARSPYEMICRLRNFAAGNDLTLPACVLKAVA